MSLLQSAWRRDLDGKIFPHPLIRPTFVAPVKIFARAEKRLAYNPSGVTALSDAEFNVGTKAR